MPEAEILMFGALLIAILDGVLFWLNESMFKDLKRIHNLLMEYYEKCDQKNNECIEKTNRCIDIAYKAVDKCNECVDYTNKMVDVINEGRQEK